ncbi:MAG TPA: hypothetical protein VFV93_15180, partial [Thermomicrobiales bacterium]|nr:hypothetical protein [Thermomicrobiales bacterium]
MTLRRWMGLVMLVALVVVTSGKIVSTAANQVPKSNAGEEKVRIHIPIPAETTPQDSTAVDTGDTNGSDSQESTSGAETSNTADSTTGDETDAGDQTADESSETGDAGQPATTDGAGAPAVQGAVVIPRPTATASSVPTVVPTSTPAPVAPTATSTPAPTATPAPPVPGNVQSAGVPPGPTSGVSWSVDGCSGSAGATGWAFMPSARAGVLTVAITNGQPGAILDCVVYLANTGTAPIAISGVVA